MRILFLEIAQIELDEAIDYYNYEMSGLGEEFLAEVLNALDRIGEYPESRTIGKIEYRMSPTQPCTS